MNPKWLAARLRRQGGGGGAKNPAAVHHIQEVLGLPLHLPDDPQIAGALGAALLALDDHRAAHKSEPALAEDDHLEQQMSAERTCAPGCKGVPSVAAQSVPAIDAMLEGQPKSLWRRLQSHI